MNLKSLIRSGESKSESLIRGGESKSVSLIRGGESMSVSLIRGGESKSVCDHMSIKISVKLICAGEQGEDKNEPNRHS